MIKIEQLLPLLKKGWVAMDYNGIWWWFKEKPNLEYLGWVPCDGDYSWLCEFDIEPVEYWTRSLMECGEE